MVTSYTPTPEVSLGAYNAIKMYLQTHPGTVITSYSDIGTVVFICMCIGGAVGFIAAVAGRRIAFRIKQTEYERVMKQQEE